MRYITLFLFLFLGGFAYGQGNLQNVRGKVTESGTSQTIPGAIVTIISDTVKRNVLTDINGNYRFNNIPPGKYSIQVKLIGYKEFFGSGLIVSSAKELIYNPELESSVAELNVAEITAYKQGETANEMSLASSRNFSVEETQRYAGSRGDPARMASNFAGVSGSDDSRNDLIVRGNSPLGILWRIDGVDIPNPNHFAVTGSTGGPVSILNNKTFDRSDFLTGAFPAEYGNSLAGVFDLRFRNGNNEKHEFTGQFGFLGTELTAEGPLSKNSGSSYLVTYRYSTLKMFEKLNIRIGTSAVPNYQDGAFKLNFPGKNNSHLTFWGIGGTSDIDIVVSKFTEPQDEIYGKKNRDQYFRTSMGVIGSTYSKVLNPNFNFKIIAAGSIAKQGSDHFLVYRDVNYHLDSIKRKLGYKFVQEKASLNLIFNRKYSAIHSIRYGMNSDLLYFDLNDSILVESSNSFTNRALYAGSTSLLQPYFQWKYKPSDKLTFLSGIHGQYFHLNKSTSIEPRFSMKYDLEKGAISFGTGIHSQTQPYYVYYQHRYNANGKLVKHNMNLDFSRTFHAVTGYEISPVSGFRIKSEVYYQYLWSIPVEKRISSYSMINQGTTFDRFFPGWLENKGKARNLGLEITAERFFSQSFFFLATVTLFDSKYTGSDNVWRNTDYNGRFISNFLGGKEFKVGKGGIIGVGGKVTWAGGKRFSPLDVTQSLATGSDVFIDSQRNSLQFRNYFRTDVKLSYKLNKGKLTHELALDLVNVTGQKNILGITYAPDPLNPAVNPVREEYQLGFLPLFYYKIDF